MSSQRVADLLAELERLRGPGVVKARPSFRSQCERRAAEAFRAAVDESELSSREVARRLAVDERSVRDWMSGARAVPGWAVCALPRDEQVSAFRALLAGVPDSDDDSESARHCA
jgi:hypothetical protein